MISAGAPGIGGACCGTLQLVGVSPVLAGALLALLVPVELVVLPLERVAWVVLGLMPLSPTASEWTLSFFLLNVAWSRMKTKYYSELNDTE